MPLFENTRIQVGRGEVLHGGADPPDEEYERTEQNFIPPSGSREQADASFGILGAEQRRPIRIRNPNDPEMTARLRPYAIRRADANLLAAQTRMSLDDFLSMRTRGIAGMLAEGATDDLESFVNRETEMLEVLRRRGPSSNWGSGVTGGADAPDADPEEEFRDRHLYEMSTPQLRRTLGMTRAALAEANTREFEEEAAALTRLIAILEELIRRRDELENYYGIVIGSGPDDDDDEPSAKRPAVSNDVQEEIRRRIDALPYAGPMYGRRPVSEEDMARMRSARAAFPDEDVARIIAHEKGRIPEPGPVREPLSVPRRPFDGSVHPHDRRRGDDNSLRDIQRQLPGMTTNQVRERLRILRLHRDMLTRHQNTSVPGRQTGSQEYLNEAIALTEEELRGRGLRGSGLKSKEMEAFLKNSYDPEAPLPAGWTRDEELSNKHAAILVDPQGNAVIAHRGTKGTVQDWTNNAIFGLTGTTGYKQTKRYQMGKKAQDRAEAKYGAKNVTTIGHSQGGLLAEELGKNSKEIITYNKATRPQDILKSQSEKQTDVRTSGDYVSAFTNPFNKKQTIAAESYVDPLGEHKPEALSRREEEVGSGKKQVYVTAPLPPKVPVGGAPSAKQLASIRRQTHKNPDLKPKNKKGSVGPKKESKADLAIDVATALAGGAKKKKLNKRQIKALARHSGQHTEKHMDEMIKLMLGGVGFREAHRRANKSVGK